MASTFFRCFWSRCSKKRRTWESVASLSITMMVLI